jgi:carbon monoxide dehydrogenase subunit G
MIRHEFTVDASPDKVWDAIRDVGAVHTRLARGFVTGCKLVGDVRTVTFANGMTVDERVISVDDDARRLAYSATGGRSEHHHATFEVRPDGDGSRIVWTTDVVPDEVGPAVRGMVEAGSRAIADTLAGSA